MSQNIKSLYTAVILAAGSGRRCGEDISKQFKPVMPDLTLLEISVKAVIPFAKYLILVLPEKELIFDEEGRIKALSSKLSDLDNRLKRLCLEEEIRLEYCAGGEARVNSAIAASNLVRTPYIFVHDAARPLVHMDDLERLLTYALEKKAALLASPVNDTVKRAYEGIVLETIAREDLWSAQTPQAFESELYRRALAAYDPSKTYTDDASLVEALGEAVHIVASHHPNPKITYCEDFEWLCERLKKS
ncbi:MAG: 2-C-methyl-D-erythritol 4-phosphate cytidylyltransferase [Candidatus Caenarcaniphilales bacterium]|nr:2-C-methyl-D-erythritol 4-phosphate cytidylyltransferase [Candidatus Caenarcaniphilales bacterium]